MKKFLVCILCLLIVCAFAFPVSAEETMEIQTTEEAETVETDETVTDTDETVTETDETVTETDETVTETIVDTEIHPPEEIPDEEIPDENTFNLLSKKFEEWVIPRLEEISVIITLIGTLVYQVRKNKSLGKALGTMNNNTVTIAEQSSDMMNRALTGMENVSHIVTAYDTRIEALLEAHRATAEDKARVEKELTEMKAYLKTSAEANIEFANELAELLGLANIPNYKKEEIGARHLAAVKSIKASEDEALHTVQGVSENVGEEA